VSEKAKPGVAEKSAAPLPQTPKETLYVSDVDREVTFGSKVFMFKAGVPRQLPEPAVRYAVGMGIEIAN
jgi:hypothetical protein